MSDRIDPGAIIDLEDATERHAQSCAEWNRAHAICWLRRRKAELTGEPEVGMPPVCLGCGGPRDKAGSYHCRECRRPVREVSGE